MAAQPPDPAEEAPPAAGEVLRGPAIRETAVRAPPASGDEVEALHYRDWFRLLADAGYVIRGKDPLAVFLTQLSRSPVVRRTQAGVYELDRDAPRRLRARLSELHEQLRRMTTAPAAATDLAEARARREQLATEVRHVEKAPEEASRLLEEPSAGGLAAAG
jgi:hypothetical protein